MIMKAIELCSMHDMQMLIIFKDLDTGKLSQYTSGDDRKGHFSLMEALREITQYRFAGKEIRTWDDDDYKGKKANQNESIDESIPV